MTEDNITMLRACKYEDLALNSKVFSASTVNYHLWIYLNPDEVRDAYFLGAEEIGPNAKGSMIFPDTFKRESQCWIRVNIGYLSQIIGKHTIKLSFVDRYTDTDFSLYVSYYLQNDDPEKPYVYMTETQDSTACTNLDPSQFTEYKG